MKRSIFEQPWAGSCIRTDAVKTPELLIGYFIGPFGAMLSSGISALSSIPRFRSVMLICGQLRFVIRSGTLSCGSASGNNGS